MLYKTEEGMSLPAALFLVSEHHLTTYYHSDKEIKGAGQNPWRFQHFVNVKNYQNLKNRYDTEN